MADGEVKYGKYSWQRPFQKYFAGGYSWQQKPLQPPIDPKRTLINMFMGVYLPRLRQSLAYQVRLEEVTPQESQQIYQEALSTLSASLQGKEWVLTSQVGKNVNEKVALIDMLSVNLPYFGEMMPETSKGGDTYEVASQYISTSGFSEDPIGWRHTIAGYEKETVVMETKVQNYLPRLLPYLIDQSNQGRIDQSEIPKLIAQAKSFIQQGVNENELPYTSGIEGYEANKQKLQKLTEQDKYAGRETGRLRQDELYAQQAEQSKGLLSASLPGGQTWAENLPSGAQESDWVRKYYANRNYPISRPWEVGGSGREAQEALSFAGTQWKAGPEIADWMKPYIENYQSQAMQPYPGQGWRPTYQGLYGTQFYQPTYGGATYWANTPTNYNLKLPGMQAWNTMSSTQKDVLSAMGTSQQDIEQQIWQRRTSEPRGAGRFRWTPMRQGV